MLEIGAGTNYHEARHAYQFSQATLPANDKDADFAVNSIAVAPFSIILDTNTPRTVCDEGVTPDTLVLAYFGDAYVDSFTVVAYALDEDASMFSQN